MFPIVWLGDIIIYYSVKYIFQGRKLGFFHHCFPIAPESQGNQTAVTSEIITVIVKALQGKLLVKYTISDLPGGLQFQKLLCHTKLSVFLLFLRGWGRGVDFKSSSSITGKLSGKYRDFCICCSFPDPFS